MKALLPNCRFLALTSAELGRDWLSLSRRIDGQLDDLGMDLAEESVYLLFDTAPGGVLAEEGVCEVARSVIGPKRKLEGSLRLFDWVQASVYRKNLQMNDSASPDWDQVLQECYQEWENLQRAGHKLVAPFIIVAKRRLNPELILSLEVLFRE